MDHKKETNILMNQLAEIERKYKQNLFDNNVQKEISKQMQTFEEKHKENKLKPDINDISLKPKPVYKRKKKILKIKRLKHRIKLPDVHNKNILKRKQENRKLTEKPVADSRSRIKEKEKEPISKKELIEKHSRINDSEIKESSESILKVKNEISKVVIGQENIIDALIQGLICNGHILLEGVPGVAKTLLIKALGQVCGCDVKRVQFTVDLLPTDIIGITSFTPGKGFEIIKGPIFANFLIADEINRSPPKTQSALIEAMQEKQVTIGKETFALPNPFFVLATKNPLESTGVYSLPEAQVDRFIFNIIMGYPKEEEELKIMEENVTLNKFEEFKLRPVINAKDILRMQESVKKIYLSNSIKNYILSIIKKTRDKKFKYSDCISYGASPRASIALFIASKAHALVKGRSYVIPEDVKSVVRDVLRHRLILSYKATIKNMTVDEIINEILEEIKV